MAELKLIGMINPLEIFPCFGSPVFQYKNDYYFQDIDNNDKIRDFKKFVNPIDITYRFKTNRYAKSEEDALFGFFFAKDDFIAAQKKQLQDLLNSRKEEFKEKPFLLISIADFLDDETEKASAIYKAYNTLLNDAYGDKIIVKNAKDWLLSVLDEYKERLKKKTEEQINKRKSQVLTTVIKNRISTNTQIYKKSLSTQADLSRSRPTAHP
ncbi:hypothetical protein MCHI_002975 [Candidatus Magnetoovum chiemensis]|nr:hypothetical protein MCHI_002975 [Candidatus Magnetoovum chiemensis]